MDSIARALATCLGAGRFPFAPATFTSLVFTVVVYVLPSPPPLAFGLFLLAVAILGVPAGTRAERFYGRDGSPIVIDEILGMGITLLFMPHIGWVYAAGFLFFRLFDIVKPPPAGAAQALPGGLGVMADDAVAGVYAHLLLRLFIWVVT
jgi:phosphatidylglycerophosphatase A